MKYKMNLTGMENDSEFIPKKKVMLTAIVSLVFFSSCNVATIQQNRVETAAPVPESKLVTSTQPVYSQTLPQGIVKLAEQYKVTYVNDKLADEEIHDNLSNEAHKNILAREYEKAINTLYEGNMQNKFALQQMLALIQYAPQLFEHVQMSDLLAKLSKPLANFVADYQVEVALNTPENNVVAAEDVKDVVIAEQKNDYESLEARFNQLKAKEKRLVEEIAVLKGHASPALPTKQTTVDVLAESTLLESGSAAQ